MSPRQTGWFTDGVNKARAEDMARQAKRNDEAKEEPVKAEPPKPLSLRERLLQTTKAVKSATSLRQTVQDAKECRATPEIVRGFAELVQQIDELAIYKIGLTLSERQAKEEWLGIAWEEQEEILQDWAKEEDEEGQVRDALEKLASFNKNLLLRDSLREVVGRFERPLRWINTIGGLKRFLDEAAGEKLVHCIKEPSYGTERGVVISGKETSLYLPNKEKPLASDGWPFVKDAEVRAKANQQKLDELKAKATPGLTPTKISAGQEGFLFVMLSPTQAVLLEAFSQGGWMAVRVEKSVGLEEDQLPTDEQEWDEGLDRLKNGNVGKWARISQALQGWVERQKQRAQAYKQEREERLSPIVDVATLPVHFEDQGLTRLLKGETGVAAMWNNRFHWGQKGRERSGLFGLAIERQHSGAFFLVAVVSDFQFPEELIGEELPLVVDAEKPEVKLETLPQMEKPLYNGLKQVEVMLKLRLGAEARAASREKAPEDKNGQNGQ